LGLVKVAGGNVGVAKPTLGSFAARWASSFQSSFSTEGCFQPTYIRIRLLFDAARQDANPDTISPFQRMKNSNEG